MLLLWFLYMAIMTSQLYLTPPCTVWMWPKLFLLIRVRPTAYHLFVLLCYARIYHIHIVFWVSPKGHRLLYIRWSINGIKRTDWSSYTSKSFDLFCVHGLQNNIHVVWIKPVSTFWSIYQAMPYSLGCMDTTV